MYIKKFEEKVPGKVAKCILTIKNARAFRALRQALNLGQYWLSSLTQLCLAPWAKSLEKFSGATPLTKSWIRYRYVMLNIGTVFSNSIEQLLVQYWG